VRVSTTFLIASGIAAAGEPVHVDVHKTTERARCFVVIAKQPLWWTTLDFPNRSTASQA
jgi:hypothetical protein